MPPPPKSSSSSSSSKTPKALQQRQQRQRQQQQQQAALSHPTRNYKLKTTGAERDIILGLQGVANLNQRQAIVRNLSPSIKKKLLSHFNRLVRQRQTHRLTDDNVDFLKTVLSPHEKSVKQLLLEQNRDQLGSGIFTFLIATLVPVIAELIRSAT